MRTLIKPVLFLGCLYGAAWGVSWRLGDKSTVVYGFTDDGGTFGFYPGVLLGGMPPNGIGMDAAQPIAIVAGTLGMVTIALSLRRSTRARHERA